MIIRVLEFTDFNLSQFATIQKAKPIAINILKFLEYKEKYFVIEKELNFKIRINREIKNVIIPIGFMTNGRTIFPRFLQKYFKQCDTKFDECYALHDFLYSKECINEHSIDKQTADKIFLNFKLAQINSLQLNNKLFYKIIAYCEYYTVRIFGKLFYNL